MVTIIKRSTPILERQARRESNARTYARNLGLALSEAKGIYVKDVDGKTYIDCLACAGALPLGHNHPAVKQAIYDALNNDLPMQTLDLVTPIKDEFVSELFESLPAEFSRNAKIQFCGPSGSDAVEAALKLVKTATGRRAVGAFRGGYHGMTHGSLALMGSLGPKMQVPGLMPDVHFFPYPYHHRYPIGAGNFEQDYQQCSQYIETALGDPEGGILPLAGLIMEIVQGEGGVIPAPDAWVREVRRITRERNIPLIVDEVQTGLGRTGTLYAFERSGITPDVIVLSKAVGGSLPLAVILYKDELDIWQPGAHAGTFRGNQLAMATGLATIRYIRENQLTTYVEQVGMHFQMQLWQIQAEFPHFIADVRGRGLMVGVELSEPVRHLARQLQAECLDRGLIIELGGRNSSVVRFLPPLIIEAPQIDDVCQIFRDAVAAIAQENI
jgi:diaminobutyrate-2-oxoglutarate transaminase